MNHLGKNLVCSFVVFFLLCVNSPASAQLQANFTAASQSGCSPLVVYFSDQSSGNPTQWRWDLGNGVISALKNPSATYFNPGTYTVKLVVRNASGTDSLVKQEFITVYANPVAAFTASDTAGCFPLPIQFSDGSTAGSGRIINWQWDFGDGSLSSLQNPRHVYTTAGNYSVTLKVTNSFGCTKTLSKIRHIQVTAGIKAGFNYTAPNACSAPSTVQFSNATSGQGNRYFWDFGDGTTSSEQNPSHVYKSNGTYTVSLIAVSPQGCRDTLKKTGLITIGKYSDFTVPAIVCANQEFTIRNTSSPTASKASWSFGDGSTSNSVSPVKKYTTEGSFTIRLVSDFGGCKDSITKNITVVKKTKPAFAASDSIACNVPFSVQFKNQTTGNNSYKWEFGDGATSTETNPLHTYTKTGTFTVKLIVFNANGCSDTLTKMQWIKIQKPVITISGVPQTGCNPVTIYPVAKVTSIKPIASYLWKFGDGATSNQVNPTHTYTVAGNYDLTLIITTVNGCTDSTTVHWAVRVGDKPKADFSAFPPEVCNANPVHFTDNSTGNVDQWFWDFGDTLSSEEQNPAHVFNGLGKFSVTLVVWSNTCADTIKKENIVNILPPVSQFSVKGTCSDKYSKEFTNFSYGATSWQWDFGDGSSSTEKNPSHNYAKPGIYKVVLHVANETCTNVSWDTVYVVDERPSIVVDKNSICKGNTIRFSSPQVHAGNIANWQWDFGDGTKSSAASSVSHLFSKTGKYTVRLKVTDILGCSDSASVDVNVYGASARFDISNGISCLSNNDIEYFDRSLTDGSHELVKRIWNYGDGVIDSVSSAPFHHSYAQSGEYNVSLTVVDAFGCRDVATKTKAVIISRPDADFYSADSVSCVGKQVSFTNQSTGYDLKYQWVFGDGTISSVKDPLHQYASAGSYNINLIATDKYGCTDSASKSNYITISLPKAKFSVSDSFGTCPPLMVHFSNQATGYVSIQWDFGDGNTSTLENPSHYYTTAGVFYAKQIITANGGCTDTVVQKIVVKGPAGHFSYSPVTGCQPLLVNFEATTQNTTSFVWDFSDGTTLSANGSSVSHTYTTPGEYLPKIILVDGSGCSVPVMGKDTIQVSSVSALFEINTNSFCKTGRAQFKNTTVANDYITQYQWNFGDGSFSNETNPSHTYANIGSYTVQLIATSLKGCVDTVALPNTITILEAPEITISGDTAACVPTSLPFKGVVNKGNASEITWQWNLSNGQSSVQNGFSTTFSSAGLYPVVAIATAKNGCKDTARLSVNIHPLPATNAGNNVSICKGSSVQLIATGASTYVWDKASSLSCTDCASPIAKPSDSVVYTVTGFTDFGCSKKDSILVNVHQPFVLTVGKGDTVCAGTPVHLVAGGADIYSWSPATNVEQSNSGSTIATPQTSTRYHLVAKDRFNCFTDTASVFIKVWPIPTVKVGADRSLVVGEAIQLQTTSSADVSSWQWNNAGTLSCSTCPVTLAKPRQTTTYTVKVKNEGGCTAQDDVTISVICNYGNLFIPNTFSPNGDGVNDKFFPGGKGINSIKLLRVFNRWGQIVFERSNFSANDEASGWDGTFKGQALSPDVYIYSCDVVCQNNEVLNFKGDVTLLR